MPQAPTPDVGYSTLHKYRHTTLTLKVLAGVVPCRGKYSGGTKVANAEGRRIKAPSGVKYGEGCRLSQPTRRSGGALRAAPAGFWAESRPEAHFGVF